MTPKILAVDDDKNFLDSLSNLLEYKEYAVEPLTNPAVAMEHFRKKEFDCVLLDVKMPGINGISLLEKFQATNPKIPIIMVSGQSTISTAVDSIK